MKKYYLDTNFILRFLLGDVTSQYEETKKYINYARGGKVELWVATPIVFELNHILENNYKLPKLQLIDTVFKFLSSSYVNVEDGQIVLDTILLYLHKNVDFEDCFLYTKAKANLAEVLTFDKDYKKLAK